MSHSMERAQPELVALEDVVTDVKTGFAVGERMRDGVIQVRTNNVGLDGSLDLNDVIRVPATDKQIADCSLNVGDVLFNNTNSTAIVGKSAVFLGHGEPVTFSNHFTRLRVDPKKLSPVYLARWLTRQQSLRVFEGLCTRWVGQSAVRSEQLLALRIPLPPLSQQRRIADLLDKADTIRQKRREAIELTIRMISSEFHRRFGDPISNSQHWPLVALALYGNVTIGCSPPRNDPDFYGDEIEWIKPDNIVPPHHWITKATQSLSEKGKSIARVVTKGATLITCITAKRDCVGNAAMTDRAVAFNQQINAITPSSSTDPMFLYALIVLSKPLVQRTFMGTMTGSASKQKLEQVQVIDIPSPAQREFGGVLRRILTLLERHHATQKESDDLFHSLVQQSF